MTPQAARPSIEVEPGVVLTDGTDAGLARQWARHALGDRWDQLDASSREQYTDQALTQLRQAHRQGRGVTHKLTHDHRRSNL